MSVSSRSGRARGVRGVDGPRTHVLPDAERAQMPQRGDPQGHPGEGRLRAQRSARPHDQARGSRLQEPHTLQQGRGRQGEIRLHHRRVRRVPGLLPDVPHAAGASHEQRQSGQGGAPQRQARHRGQGL